MKIRETVFFFVLKCTQREHVHNLNGNMARSALNDWYFMNQKFYCLAHLTVVAALVTSPKEPFTLKEPLKIHISIFLYIQHQVLKHSTSSSDAYQNEYKKNTP